VDAEPARARAAQPAFIRLAHWLNVPALVVMAGSGLQILVAYPEFGPRGATYAWYPLAGRVPPAWLRLGGWLAGARSLHFALAWLLVVNGLAYLAYLLLSGEWRRRVFRPVRDTGGAARMVLHYLRIAREPPPAGLYNPLQRLAYTAAVALIALQIVSGLAIYKPVQLSWLAAALGGYDSARFIHFAGLVLLALFTVGHVTMVLLHPRSLVEMLTGGARR
jgi:Ni/Fe-hydrogenase b-type cytochrome subunit